MTLKEAIRLHKLYLYGNSLEDLEKKHTKDYSRQQIFYYFKAFNLEIRSRKKSEIKIFNNKRYSFKSNYWTRTSVPRTLMHRDIYEYHNGPLSKDYNVVFKDQNPHNLDINNLKAIHKTDLSNWSKKWSKNEKN